MSPLASISFRRHLSLNALLMNDDYLPALHHPSCGSCLGDPALLLGFPWPSRLHLRHVTLRNGRCCLDYAAGLRPSRFHFGLRLLSRLTGRSRRSLKLDRLWWRRHSHGPAYPCKNSQNRSHREESRHLQHHKSERVDQPPIQSYPNHTANEDHSTYRLIFVQRTSSPILVF